jgi:IS1 family transposase
MNRLPLDTRAKLLHMLVEGNSLRATSRMADVAYNSVLKLVSEAGKACSDYQDMTLRNLPCKHIQVDEIWAFCYTKQKNLENAKRPVEGAGDIWTWTAICADCKLVPSWLVGARDAEYGSAFMHDLKQRLREERVQLTSDGHRVYLEAVESAFGADIDYAMLIKLYGTPPEAETRYSPVECIGVQTQRIQGNPAWEHISTSFVERQNLTMRMAMRRFTRLTNGFSKKAENHAYAVALHYMHYNFGRIHKTLRVTPAMEAGVSDHVWTIEEIAKLMDANYVPKTRGPYKKKIQPKNSN